MRKTTFQAMALLALTLVIGITACKKEKAIQEDNDNEIITTVELHFTEQGTSNSITYTWRDLDGDGGNPPVVNDVVLAANKVYNVTLRLLDETKNPAENITTEIEAEAVDHRFYFTPSAGANIAVTNLNNDANGVPLGITSTWTTTAAAKGKIEVVLRHYAAGGKAVDDAVNSSKSSTDVDVSFNTEVK